MNARIDRFLVVFTIIDFIIVMIMGSLLYGREIMFQLSVPIFLIVGYLHIKIQSKIRFLLSIWRSAIWSVINNIQDIRDILSENRVNFDRQEEIDNKEEWESERIDTIQNAVDNDDWKSDPRVQEILDDYPNFKIVEKSSDETFNDE